MQQESITFIIEDTSLDCLWFYSKSKLVILLLKKFTHSDKKKTNNIIKYLYWSEDFANSNYDGLIFYNAPQTGIKDFNDPLSLTCIKLTIYMCTTNYYRYSLLFSIECLLSLKHVIVSIYSISHAYFLPSELTLSIASFARNNLLMKFYIYVCSVVVY